ncbi:zinc ABC transporter ATP-binding protein AztA [Microbacterium oleivorans]|uniref:ATP-binding cassette domain-containing protein n=1 Tax=Microbacterium oleivorans TaxID=273677 RepID=A0A7D5EUT9_9MICO|nr:zinc ABC transporter ATP-binding protein AztA [Microbacterium oleivorans]QLD11312.1 ATP-binding cassette domain-containing protein [Microbacterium oleivorans]
MPNLSLPLCDRVLDLRDVVVAFDGHVALRGVTLQVERGEVVAVVGANGSGKSTLLAVSAGLLAPTAGSVHRPPGTRIALVPQATNDGARLPLTVTDLVAMGRWRERGAFRPLRRSDRIRIADAIETVGLADLARRPLGLLSGGQRQRAYLAQALAQDADLLLLDEPMSGLDAPSRGAAASALTTVAAAGVAVIVVTHDLGELGAVDRVCRIDDGRIAASSAAGLAGADRATATSSDAPRGRGTAPRLA